MSVDSITTAVVSFAGWLKRHPEAALAGTTVTVVTSLLLIAPDGNGNHESPASPSQQLPATAPPPQHLPAIAPPKMAELRGVSFPATPPAPSKREPAPAEGKSAPRPRTQTETTAHEPPETTTATSSPEKRVRNHKRCLNGFLDSVCFPTRE